MSARVFVDHARTLLGARWRHRGRKRWAVDCIGLLVLAGDAADLKWDVIRIEKRYGREPWDDRLRKELRLRFGEPVKDWQLGDIALIRWNQGEPSHVAIIGDHPDGGLSMIHAHNVHGVVEHSLTGRYLSSIVEVYRPWPV